MKKTTNTAKSFADVSETDLKVNSELGGSGKPSVEDLAYKFRNNGLSRKDKTKLLHDLIKCHLDRIMSNKDNMKSKSKTNTRKNQETKPIIIDFQPFESAYKSIIQLLFNLHTFTDEESSYIFALSQDSKSFHFLYSEETPAKDAYMMFVKPTKFMSDLTIALRTFNCDVLSKWRTK